MASRAEKKALTRNALIDSWLRIIGSGTNFAAVSLREVAKTAGVVPTSFYRHFDDMDELGLAAVDELGLDLRRLMRGGVPLEMAPEDLLRTVVKVYVQYVQEHADLVQFANQARTGGSPALREAIEHELDFFRTRVASSIGEAMPEVALDRRDTVAAVVVAVLLESTTEVLVLAAKSQARRAEVIARLESRLTVVLQGAAMPTADASPDVPVRAVAPTRLTRKAATS